MLFFSTAPKANAQLVESNDGEGEHISERIAADETESSNLQYSVMRNERYKQLKDNAMADSDKKPTILVAEDNESNYLLVSYLLRSEYDLLWARDGVEALELYRANHVDLILMDVRMPRMGGLATTEQIRRTDTKTPIIALTAFAFDSDRAQTLDAGCNDFVPKPINAEILKAKIRKFIFGEE